MERKNEVILQNAMLENVLRYLYDKLKGVHNASFDETLKDGTIIYYSLYVYPVHSNKIEVTYSTSVTPKGDIEKSYAKWDMYPAMDFEGLQLQTGINANTVKIKAECKHHFFMSIFDRYWADMLKEFGAAQPIENKNLIVKLSRNDVYRQLLAMCNDGEVFSLQQGDYQDIDLECLTVADRKAITEHPNTTAKDKIIGYIRLLPNNSDTLIVFVHRNRPEWYNFPVINSDLWGSFINSVFEYFKGNVIATQVGVAKPEKALEDTTGWDSTLIEMWNKGHSRDEIANRVNVSKDRVTNRVTELRNKFGENIVPYDKDRKKRLIKA